MRRRELEQMARALVHLRNQRARFTVEDFAALAGDVGSYACGRFLAIICSSGLFGLTNLGLVAVRCVPYGSKKLVSYGFEGGVGCYDVEEVVRWWCVQPAGVESASAWREIAVDVVEEVDEELCRVALTLPAGGMIELDLLLAAGADGVVYSGREGCLYFYVRLTEGEVVA